MERNTEKWKPMWIIALVSVFLLCQPVEMVAAKTTSYEVNLSLDKEKNVTLDLKEATVKDLFDAIHRQTGLDFVYNTEQMSAMPPITVSAKNESVEKLLGRVFVGKGFSFKRSGNMITVTKADNQNVANSHSSLQGQRPKTGKTISGIVVYEEDGSPVVGATVKVVGKEIGTATDLDGRFELKQSDVAVGEQIQISYIGMETQVVAASSSMKVMLKSDTHELKDVVITGIFKKAKESYTGAVSTISEKQLDMYKGQNLLQTLKNIDASINFQVNNLAGSNPNNLPQINIRGNSSLPMSVQEFNETASNSVNTPLIIMDGFEISLEKLMDYNDEEIESINILKDAAATAIYGSRGSNGVIVIVTKQPEAGRLRVNAEVGIDMEVPDLTSYDMLNAAEKLSLENSLGLYHSSNPSTDLEYQAIYNKRLRSVLSGQSTDWLHKPVRTGVGSHYNIRLEGGSDEFRWSTTANYKNVEGAMKNSGRSTFNGSITLMYSKKNVIFRNYTSYGITRARESNYGSFSDYVAQQPYNSPYDENGEITRYFENFYGTGRGYGEFNPLYDASLKSFDKNGYEEITNNFSVEWNILEGLTFRGQLGISSTNDHSDTFLSPKNSYFTVDIDTAPEYSTDEGFLRRGSYTYGTGKTYNYSGNATLSYSKVFKEKHQLYVGLDYSIRETKSDTYLFQLEGFTNENMNSIGNARQYAENSIPSSATNHTRMLGFTSNANYIYDGRYYVDLSYRIDGSSTFGADKKYAPFWSTGIGWNIHNEKFMSENPLLNILRLKLSYGQTGSQQGSGSGASTLYKYQTNNKYMNWTGAVLQEWGNPRLTWQTTDEFNVGAEFGLWNGRVRGEFNFYTKTTSNLLSSMNLPLSMGFPSYIANIGEVKNRGWEASLSAYIIRDHEKELNWMITGQLVYNKNWISKLSEAIKKQNETMLQSDDYDVANLFYEDRPQNAIYAVRSLGIDPSTGNEIFLDKDGNVTDTWKAGDKVYLGSADPLYRGNLSSMLMWKGFTLNVSFGYYWGGKMYNETLMDRVEVTLGDLTTSNVDRRVYTDRWTKPGDVAFFKKIDNDRTRATSRFVMDNNVLELQSVSLQYKWDNNWIRRYTGAQSVTFGVNMSDLFHWSTVKMERGTNYPYSRNIQGSMKLVF